MDGGDPARHHRQSYICMQWRWRPQELVEPGGWQDWQRQEWRPRRLAGGQVETTASTEKAEFTGAGRTRWRPQMGNHKEVDRQSPGLVVGTQVAEVENLMESLRSLGSGIARKSKASSQKETGKSQ